MSMFVDPVTGRPRQLNLTRGQQEPQVPEQSSGIFGQPVAPQSESLSSFEAAVEAERRRLMAAAPPAPEAPADDGTAFGRGLRRGIPQTLSTLAAGAGALGFEDIQQYLSGIATEQEMEILRENPELLEGVDFRDIRGVNSFLSYLGELAGEQAPLIGGTLLAGGATALAGASAPVAAVVGTVAASGPLLFGGNVQRRAEVLGINPEDLPDEDVSRAALYAVGQTALEALTNTVFVGRLGAGAARQIVENASAESIAELGQIVLERAQAGLELDSPDAYEEYLQGIVAALTLGGVFGGVGAIVGDRSARAQRERELTEDQNEESQQIVMEARRAQEGLQKEQQEQAVSPTADEDSAIALPAPENRIAETEQNQALKRIMREQGAPFRRIRLSNLPLEERLAINKARTASIDAIKLRREEAKLPPIPRPSDPEYNAYQDALKRRELGTTTVQELQAVIGSDAAAREAAKQKPALAAAGQGLYTVPESAKFNQDQIEAAIARVQATGKVNFPIVRRAIAEVTEGNVPNEVTSSVIDELVNRGLIRRIDQNGKKKYEVEPDIKPVAEQAPVARERRELDRLEQEIQQAQERRDRLAEDIRRVEQTGQTIEGRKIKPSTARNYLREAEKQLSTLKNQAEQARQRVRGLNLQSIVPTRDRALPRANEAEVRARIELLEQEIADAKKRESNLRRAVTRAGENATAQQRERLAAQEAAGNRLRALREKLNARLLNPSAAVQVKPEETAGQKARVAAGFEAEAGTATTTPQYDAAYAGVMGNLRKRLDKMGLKDIALEFDERLLREQGADGSYKNKLIKLASGIYDRNLTEQQLTDRMAAVMDHEVIHALKALNLFTDAEWKTLSRAAAEQKYVAIKNGKPVERSYTYLRRAQEMYPDQSPEIQVEEAIAEMFRHHTGGTKRFTGRPGNLLQRIVNFFKSVFRANEDSGFQRPSDIFERAERGELAARRAEPRAEVEERLSRKVEIENLFEAMGDRGALAEYPGIGRAVDQYINQSDTPQKLRSNFYDAINDPDYPAYKRDLQVNLQRTYGDQNVPVSRVEGYADPRMQKVRKNYNIPQDDVFLVANPDERELIVRLPDGSIRSARARDNADIRRIIGYDNPGGEWLENKRRNAAKMMSESEPNTGAANGVRGPITAYTRGAVTLPLDKVKNLPGANNEQPRPGQVKYDDLLKSVRENGFRGDSPILIGINHLGFPFITEGNNRVAIARRFNLPNIQAEIRWFNGGEETSINWSPAAVEEMVIEEARQSRRLTGDLTRLDPETGDTPDRISTRQPWTQRSTEDPLAENLIIGLEAMKQNPEAFAYNMDVIKTYPGFNTSATDPDQIAENFISFVSGNLRWLYNQVPQEIRDRSKQWYDGARAITERWTQDYNLEDYKIAGVLAALSPQKDWYQNVSLGERLLDIVTTYSSGNLRAWTPEPAMRETAARIYKKPDQQADVEFVLSNPYTDMQTDVQKAMWVRTFDETYNPRGYRIVSSEGEFIGEPQGNAAWGSNVEIAKAIRSIEAASRDDVSQQMGTKHKVRNFYNNILAPNAPQGDVTIDTHAVAAGLLRPLSGNSYEVHHNFGSSPAVSKRTQGQWIPMKNIGDSGSHGSYGIYAEAYRRLANELGILPRQLQSITWEAVRGLFSARQKQSAPFVSSINSIWSNSRLGDDLDVVRNRVLEAAGGIDDPTWFDGSDSPAPAAPQDSSYAGELVDPRLRRRPAGELATGDRGADGTAGRTGAVSPEPLAEGERLSRRLRLSVVQQMLNEASGTSNDIGMLNQLTRYTDIADKLGKMLGVVLFDKQKGQRAADFLIQKMQDSFIPVGRMIKELKEQGLTVYDVVDPYLQDQLAKGRTGGLIEDRDRTIYREMGNAINALNVSKAMKDSLTQASDTASGRATGAARTFFQEYKSDKLALADLYLYARHALERNEYVRIIDRSNDFGSGMTDAEANAILNWIDSNLDEANRNAISRIDSAARAIVADTNRVRREAGLIPAEDMDVDFDGTEGKKQSPNFQYYVPVRGAFDDDATTQYESSITGKRFNVRGKEDPTLLGRENYGRDIVANLMFQNTNSIVRAERNKVNNALLNLFEQNPELMARYGRILKTLPQKRKLNDNGMVQYVTDFKEKESPNVVIVKRDGKDVVIALNDANLAGAFNGKNVWDVGHANVIIRSLAQLNRYLSNVITSWNPEFGLTNFSRDLQGAGVNISEIDLPGLRRDVIFNTRKAIIGMKRAIRNEDYSSEWAQKYLEFTRAGGKSAANPMATLADQLDNVQSMLKDFDEGARIPAKGKKAVKALGKILEDYNTVIENAVRLTTYDALRKRGFSEARAAQAARSVTVDFTKTGDMGQFVNSMYLFYNASLQGSFFLLRAAARSKRVRRVLAGAIAMGFMMDFINSMVSDEDEAGIKEYDKFPDWFLEHNWVIMLPDGLATDGFERISIPMPYGLNFFYNVGRSISRAGRGTYDIGQASESITNTLLEMFNPFGGTESFANFAAPTFYDPIASLAGNVDYDETSIRRDPFPNQNIAASHLYWNNTSPTAIAAAQALNRLSGGTATYGGWADVSPDTLEFLFRYITGGAGQFVQRTAELPVRLSDPELENEDILREIPVIRKLFGAVSSREDLGTYIRMRDRVLVPRNEMKAAVDDRNRERIARLRQQYSASDFRIAEQVYRVELARRRITRQMNEIRDNENIPEDRKRELLDRLDQQQQRVILRGLQLMMEQD